MATASNVLNTKDQADVICETLNTEEIALGKNEEINKLIQEKPQTPKKRSREDLLQIAVDLLQQININKNNKVQYDDIERVGLNYAYRLKQLSATQQFFCEHIVGEVLYYGAMGSLTPNSRLQLSVDGEHPEVFNYGSTDSLTPNSHLKFNADVDHPEVINHLDTQQKLSHQYVSQYFDAFDGKDLKYTIDSGLYKDDELPCAEYMETYVDNNNTH